MIDLTNDHGRRLKNRSAHRRIPVPQILIDHGFLEYVEMRRGKRTKGLFPELQGRGAAISGEKLRKRFDNYKKNFVTEEYVFHGLRHSFATEMLQKDGVAKHLVAQLAGHKIGGETGDRYFKGFELQVLKKAIEGVGEGLVAAALSKAGATTA